MRLRICSQPAVGALDGISLNDYRAGGIYDLSPQLANLFLAEGWAEPLEGDETARPFANEVSALVLVVDDDTDLRQLTATVLSCNGYRVVQAQHGREALGRLASDTPDLVVLDLNMPVMDGWEFRGEQQRLADGRLAAIPVLLLTGADGADGHAGVLKAVGLIKKPFDPEELLGAIGTALGSKPSLTDPATQMLYGSREPQTGGLPESTTGGRAQERRPAVTDLKKPRAD